MRYPNIYMACFAVTLDNGGLNRDRSKDQILGEYETWLQSVEANHSGEWDLPAIDKWIHTLTEEQLEILTAGEETEMMELSAQGPAGVNDLLNLWFDEVC